MTSAYLPLQAGLDSLKRSPSRVPPHTTGCPDPENPDSTDLEYFDLL